MAGLAVPRHMTMMTMMIMMMMKTKQIAMITRHCDVLVIVPKDAEALGL